MQKFRCLIVDDEELAQDVIEKYIESMPMLEVLGKCKNAPEAIGFLLIRNVDILFLDINMPEINGLEMLSTLNTPPKVILTTAYSEFAVEGYEYGVVDYLLKPIRFDRFVKAVNRAMEQLSVKEQAVMDAGQHVEEPGCLFIKEDHITHNIDFSRIIFIQAYGNYLKIFTADKTYVIRETLHDIVRKLPERYFIRVHKSYVVSFRKIKKIMGNVIFIDDHEIPIGTVFKSELTARLYS